MEESKIINRNLIFLDEPKVDKEQIIKFFANKLKENHYIDDENTFYEAVLDMTLQFHMENQILSYNPLLLF